MANTYNVMISSVLENRSDDEDLDEPSLADLLLAMSERPDHPNVSSDDDDVEINLTQVVDLPQTNVEPPPLLTATENV